MSFSSDPRSRQVQLPKTKQIIKTKMKEKKVKTNVQNLKNEFVQTKFDGDTAAVSPVCK